MSTILIVLLVLLLVGVFPAYQHGGPYIGGGLGVVVLILLILLLLGRI